jgi:hypothetical protein
MELSNDTLTIIIIISVCYVIIKEFAWWTWRHDVVKWIITCEYELEKKRKSENVSQKTEARKVSGKTEVTESNIESIIKKLDEYPK